MLEEGSCSQQSKEIITQSSGSEILFLCFNLSVVSSVHFTHMVLHLENCVSILFVYFFVVVNILTMFFQYIT